MGPREFHERLSSTQDRAIALARAGAEEGTRVVARRQSGGRGRAGRSWESPDGGLYLSVVLATPPPPETLLPLAIGACLARGLAERFGVSLRLKWPNDVVAVAERQRPRKVAGILLDTVASPTLGKATIAGVGVNARVDPRTLTGPVVGTAGSLHTLSRRPVTLEHVEAEAVEAALSARRALSAPDGAAAVRDLCTSLLYGIGNAVTVDGVRSGRIETLGDDGALWVAAGASRFAVRAGDVRVEEEA